jgi:hypothetical protein
LTLASRRSETRPGESERDFRTRPFEPIEATSSRSPSASSLKCRNVFFTSHRTLFVGEASRE